MADLKVYEERRLWIDTVSIQLRISPTSNIDA